MLRPKLCGFIRVGVFVLCGWSLLGPSLAAEPKTERQYLSGHGPNDAMPWNFSITAGRRAGEKTTIPVPSNWELQGFGSYHYGQQKTKTDEHGLFHTSFTVSPEWNGRRVWLVFDGVMTDATVTVNGKIAGPMHQGGFYRFRYDVTKLLNLVGTNTLDVDVAKVSSNPGIEGAERMGDYWVFGGIYRPVFLEATPVEAIGHIAIDARADGALSADVTLSMVRNADRIDGEVIDASGHRFGPTFGQTLRRGGSGRIQLTGQFEGPLLWTAETPALYTLRLTLKKGAEVVHVIEQRFGFRTFEVRDGQGLFLNGQRVLLKGVNRHCFRPETGRALDPEDGLADIRLMREMNMNAVRMSHYPPDEAFLDACDEIGLYVLDELSGWQKAHDTSNGRRLIREMIERDVNHPSIVLWDNGNEGGNNLDLDEDFGLYDPQHRRVLHPWALRDGINTKHYPNFDLLTELLKGPDLVMPTEFLHGLYDGGAGAGLDDYWKAIEGSPFGAGGFLWVYSDEGVVRTDLSGKIDVFSTFAPDGIVGPHLEKEGSVFTIRDIWSPIQVATPAIDAAFDGTLRVHNAYDFTSLAQCRFRWEWIHFEHPTQPSATTRVVVAQGELVGPPVAPHAEGRLLVPVSGRKDADMLALTAIAATGEALSTWTWATSSLSAHLQEALAAKSGSEVPSVKTADRAVMLQVGQFSAAFDPQSGLLRELRDGSSAFALQSGPRLAFAHPAADAPVTWYPFVEPGIAAGTRTLTQPQPANVVEVEVDDLHGADALSGLKLELSPDGEHWTTIFEATRRPQDGNRYEFPPQPVKAVRLSDVRRYDGKPPVLKSFQVGYAATRFPTQVSSPAILSSGTARDPKNGMAATAWLEARGGPSGLDQVRWTLHSNGQLQLDYAYTLDGTFVYHGITFDHPEGQIASFRWLGEGPYRVWQNRLRGTNLNVYQHDRHATQPGESWNYPEFEGYFAGLRSVLFTTAQGRITATTVTPDLYFRVGTPRVSAATTTVEFPAGEISFLHAIPAIGSKGKPPEKAGPASQYATAKGRYSGTIYFDIAGK